MQGNPFADPALVTGYEDWYRTVGLRADRLEKQLLAQLLTGFPQARTLLEVGCGTGHFTRWFRERGLHAQGLDVSQAMLSEATRLDSPSCLLGDGLALPFLHGGFDLVSLITTLEIIDDPIEALREAARVARLGLILGVISRQSLLAWQLKRLGRPPWQTARLYTPHELADLVQQAASRETGILWRTTLWPVMPWACPWPGGGFIGMAVKLGGTQKE